MTTVYFVRHAEPDPNDHNNRTRKLSPKGIADREKVTAFLQDKAISALYASPYPRSAETIQPFASKMHLPITLLEDFRERTVTTQWLADGAFENYSCRQWADFGYKLPGGESLREVQQRNIAALNKVLSNHSGESIVIGTHGCALSTIIAHYVPSFGYEDYQKIVPLLPCIVRFRFDGTGCRGIHMVMPDPILSYIS